MMEKQVMEKIKTVSPEVSEKMLTMGETSGGRALSVDERIHFMNNGIEDHTKTIATNHTQTKEELATYEQKRAELGLPPSTEDPISVKIQKKKIKNSEQEREILKQEKKKILEEYKAEYIEAQKDRMAKEIAESLKEIYTSLSEEDKNAVRENGKLLNSKTVEIKHLGVIRPEQVQQLVQLFEEYGNGSNEDFIKKVKEQESVQQAIQEKGNEEYSEQLKSLERQSEGDAEQKKSAIDGIAMREIPIGYEGNKYSPETLLAKIESQQGEIEKEFGQEINQAPDKNKN